MWFPGVEKPIRGLFMPLRQMCGVPNFFNCTVPRTTEVVAVRDIVPDNKSERGKVVMLIWKKFVRTVAH